ncbi:unnamed protein product [Rotaria sp. Silwood2]|nr:unnamed protein product [Rotaria sp. Silwood2]CAF2733324.1 unnamed protein product [Rotaria sp. Silwood2]CAF3007269.1 unnamed protein product [Rotaria sp. Silwood2]CAF3149214.1 unnamed protein product [Rotaria sp. Silwood2]CAF3865295.1 unnamed protein product [Rotaria sp. Silwood2]
MSWETKADPNQPTSGGVTSFHKFSQIQSDETVQNDEIENTLASEFQTEEEEGEATQQEEDADTAKGHIDEMIEQQVNDAKEKAEGVKKVFQQEYVPFSVVKASDKPRYVRNCISKKIERFTALRENLFERVYSIKAQLAQKLIDIGYLHYSKFGKFCPVSLYNGDCYPPPFEPDKPPCTVGDAIRYILEKQHNTILGKEMQQVLVKGNEIGPETAIRCLEVALMNTKCETRGYKIQKTKTLT